MTPRPPLAARPTHDRAAVVSTQTLWIPVGPDTPRGAKVQLINRSAGVATYGHYAPGSWWTHWHPLPRFDDGC